MKNRFVLTICLIATILFTLTAALPSAYAMGIARKLGWLEERIDELEDTVSQTDTKVRVNCTTDSITDALADAPLGGPYIIKVEGNCVESFTITRDDVTLQGGSGEVNGQITVDGARRVVIDNLTVTGVGHGILAQNNASVTVLNSIIEKNDFSGIAVTTSAFTLIDGNTIEFNTECEIIAFDSGHVIMLNNDIESNQDDPNICVAVGSYRDSTIRMRGGNEVTQKGGWPATALSFEHGSTFRQDGGHDTIKGRVGVFNMTNADFRDVDITGIVSPWTGELTAIAVDLNSNLRLRDQGRVANNVTATGDIIVSSESLADFQSSAVIDGNVICNRGFVDGMEVNRGFINRSPSFTPGRIPADSIINCFITPPPPPPPLPCPPPGPCPPPPPPP